MIEIAMAIALGVAPVPEPIVRVDPEIDGAYRSIEQPCTALQAAYPGMVEQFCTDDLEVFVSGTGAQVELGFFRARLTEGEFVEGGYITRQSWQFLDTGGLSKWRTARGVYSLACVEQNTGLIERNGPPVFVIVPAGAESGSSTITLKTSGQCRLGYEREVLSMWAFSDSALPWQNAGDFDRSADGWVDGVRTIQVGRATLTATAPLMPDYGELGFVYAEVYMDAQSRALVAAAREESILECHNVVNDILGGDHLMSFGVLGAGIQTGPSSVSFCSEDRPGIWGRAGEITLVSQWTGNSSVAQLHREHGAVFFFPFSSGSLAGPSLGYFAPGTPDIDRYEVTGQIAVSATLTKVDGVRDLVWEPQARPFTLPLVEGLCVDDLLDCFRECRDLIDPGLNPLDNFQMLWDIFVCVLLPTTDLSEFVSVLWQDQTGTVAYQSVEYMVYAFQDLLQAPAYYARECGTLLETDLDSVGQGNADQAFNTCDLDEQTRGLIFTLSGLLIAASFVFMSIRLFFYALKQRNMLIGAQMMEDDYAAADEKQNG